MALRLVNGSIFLHIPKTGGEWVTQALRECNLVDRQISHKHADFDRTLNGLWAKDHALNLMSAAREGIRRRFGVARAEPYRFTFVRHPLRWYESFWKYMKSRGWQDWGEANSRRNWHPNAILNGLGDDDFNTCVRNIIRKRPGYVSELFFAYAKAGVDFIGRTESLTEDLIATLYAQNVKFDEAKIRGLAKINVSKSAAAEIDWDPELKRTVTLLELPALLHFGYLTAAAAEQLGITEVIAPNPALHRG